MSNQNNLLSILPLKKPEFIEPNALNDALKAHPDIGMDSVQLYVDAVAIAKRHVQADPDDIEWFKCYRDTVKEIYKKIGVSAPTTNNNNNKNDPADTIPIEELRKWQDNLMTRSILSHKQKDEDVSPE